MTETAGRAAAPLANQGPAAGAATAGIIDDKSEHCIPFILSRLRAHREQHAEGAAPPFFVGVNGVQGAGKTTLV
jgi:pantothenate kinase-related protein Tda10